jgi:protein arginine N-methyltransferase 1
VFKQLVRGAFNQSKAFVKRSSMVQSLLYDIQNRTMFTDVKWHERMLSDKVRVDTYRDGIAGNVKPGDVVIDLGTGTGLLAFFAARSGARTVYAVDHSDFIDVAKQIGERNGIGNVVFVKTNSRDFAPPEKADVLVHEQIGRALFGENMIENLLDLKRRALKPSGRILPARFDFYVEPMVKKEGYRVPFLWDNDATGIDLSFLKSSTAIDPFKDKTYPYLSIKCLEVDYFLTDPEPVLSLDLDTIQSAADIPTRFEVVRKVARAGMLDGFCVYFRVRFDDTVNFDTSPFSPQTSWDNLELRTERRQYDLGDEIRYSLALEVLHDSNTWSVSVGA